MILGRIFLSFSDVTVLSEDYMMLSMFGVFDVGFRNGNELYIINCFSWAGGSLLFKRSSTEFSTES